MHTEKYSIRNYVYIYIDIYRYRHIVIIYIYMIYTYVCKYLAVLPFKCCGVHDPLLTSQNCTARWRRSKSNVSSMSGKTYEVSPFRSMISWDFMGFHEIFCGDLPMVEELLKDPSVTKKCLIIG